MKDFNFIIKTSIISVLFVYSICSFSQESQIDTNLISIAGTGDIMLGSNYPSDARLPINDGRELLRDVKDILKDADITFGNLEGCFLNSGGSPKSCKSKCYYFRMPDKYVNYLTDAGYDLISVANNHSGDFGAIGRENTLKVLREAGLNYAGLEGICETSVAEINGIKYGFCCFAPNSGTLKITNISNAKKIVSQLKSECNIVIVSFHGGAEGKANNRVTRKTETFYGENRGNVYEFAHAVIDAGADVVFGHGPHVVRAAELYNDRFIIYSMGNFCTAGEFEISGINGYAPVVKVFTDKDGKFVKGQIFSFLQKDKTGPHTDKDNAAAKEIKRLTELDFPETDLLISNEGFIQRKSNIISENIENTQDSSAVNNDNISVMQRIIEFSKQFLGIPYHRGSKGPKSFDCSGFTSFVFGNFGYQIGASCLTQIQQGMKVMQDELQTGDLIFFKGRNNKSNNVGHVGIVISNDKNGNVQFIHSCLRGVIIDELNKSSYYKSRYIMGLRIFNNKS
ncbi:MAG: CapA family protein [Prevotellaceae bacterium]|jgi:poly-gamma-glutamate capsule biosynthesis protein CapA/YwtB (metallophosphatase superfamily)/cell wall-associated NlpC family hydrolase|nr:CapA family protein [Prevotellaceae bacterium]